MSKKIKKVVLAYSGGLDTSVIVRWLIETYGCEVVCFAADVIDGPQSVVIDEAENRLHVQKAVLEILL